MRKFETAQFLPAFELGDRVRINDNVSLHAKQLGEVIEFLAGDHYRVDLGYATPVFARAEVAAVK
jgi:hypothetical protein